MKALIYRQFGSPDKLLINGASGGVGHFAVQIANAMGAEVHAVCGPGNLQFATSLGADFVYSYADRPAPEIDLDLDVVFDVFGKLSRAAFARQLGNHGTYVSTVPKPATLWAEGLARVGISKVGRLVRVQSRAEDLGCLKAWPANGVEKRFEMLTTIDGCSACKPIFALSSSLIQHSQSGSEKNCHRT
jgi:NADPH:quinone reductase-like Zn-dependent oxidoreductase